MGPNGQPPGNVAGTAGNGTYQSHHGAFDARVARDGTVQLHDKGSVELSPGCIFGGCPMNLDDAMMRAAQSLVRPRDSP